MNATRAFWTLSLGLLLLGLILLNSPASADDVPKKEDTDGTQACGNESGKVGEEVTCTVAVTNETQQSVRFRFDLSPPGPEFRITDDGCSAGVSAGLSCSVMMTFVPQKA